MYWRLRGCGTNLHTYSTRILSMKSGSKQNSVTALLHTQSVIRSPTISRHPAQASRKEYFRLQELRLSTKKATRPPTIRLHIITTPSLHIQRPSSPTQNFSNVLVDTYLFAEYLITNTSDIINRVGERGAADIVRRDVRHENLEKS